MGSPFVREVVPPSTRNSRQRNKQERSSPSLFPRRSRTSLPRCSIAWHVHPHVRVLRCASRISLVWHVLDGAHLLLRTDGLTLDLVEELPQWIVGADRNPLPERLDVDVPAQKLDPLHPIGERHVL